MPFLEQKLATRSSNSYNSKFESSGDEGAPIERRSFRVPFGFQNKIRDNASRSPSSRSTSLFLRYLSKSRAVSVGKKSLKSSLSKKFPLRCGRALSAMFLPS